MTSKCSPVEQKLFLVGLGDTGSYSEALMHTVTFGIGRWTDLIVAQRRRLLEQVGGIFQGRQFSARPQTIRNACARAASAVFLSWIRCNDPRHSQPPPNPARRNPPAM